jgi:solute carrier family 25 phosphate transporter 23/24/25/41
MTFSESKRSMFLDSNALKSLFAGAVAGAVSRTATSPLERLKVMKQVQTGSQYSGILAPFQQMYKQEGILSFWKGNGTNVARIAPYSAIQFFTFDKYKKVYILFSST